jgi:hypothetical protein
MGDEERLTWTKTILFNPQSVITMEVLTFIAVTGIFFATNRGLSLFEDTPRSH